MSTTYFYGYATPPPAAAKLATPVAKQATNITSNSVLFSWLPVEGADGYQVRLNGMDVYKPGNVTSYTATGLPAMRDVQFEVLALDSTRVRSSSDYCSPVVATTEAAAAPKPTINSFSPTTATPGDMVTVSGTNFGALQTVAGKLKAAGILSNVYNWSDTEITFKVPVGGATGTIEIAASDGQKVVSTAALAVLPERQPEEETTTATQEGAAIFRLGLYDAIQHLAVPPWPRIALGCLCKPYELGGDSIDNIVIHTFDGGVTTHILGFRDFGTKIAFGINIDGLGYQEVTHAIDPADYVGKYVYLLGEYDGAAMRLYQQFPGQVMELLPETAPVTGNIVPTVDATVLVGAGDGTQRVYKGEIVHYQVWDKLTPSNRIAYSYNAVFAPLLDPVIYGGIVPGLYIYRRYNKPRADEGSTYEFTPAITPLSLRVPVSTDPLPTLVYTSGDRQLVALNNVPGSSLEYRVYGGKPQPYVDSITVSDRFQAEGKYEFRVAGDGIRFPSRWAKNPLIESSGYQTTFVRCDMTTASTDFTTVKNVQLAFSNITSTFTPEQLPTIAATAVRGGNSSFTFTKPRFNIVLASKLPLFGFPAETDFRFLADYRAPDLQATLHAFYLSSLLGLSTPRFQVVILYINGEEAGVYIATQKVKLGMITSDKPIGTELNGPALIQKAWDEQETNAQGVAYAGAIRLNTTLYNGTNDYHGTAADNTPHSIILESLKLATATQEQKDAVTASLNAMEASLTQGWETVKSTLDAPSTLANFCLQEYTRNRDAESQSSYMYKLRGGKWTFGPSWDFDLAFALRLATNDIGYGPGKYVARSPYYSRLDKDAGYNQALGTYVSTTFYPAVVQAIDFANEAGYLLQVNGYADTDDRIYGARSEVKNYFIGSTTPELNYHRQLDAVQAARVRQLNWFTNVYAS